MKRQLEVLLICVTLLALLVAAHKKPTRAVFQSIGGCLMGDTPEVQSFVRNDLKFYSNVEYIPKSGYPNQIHFYSEDNELLDTVYVDSYTRDECNQVMTSRGFDKKDTDQYKARVKVEL